MIEVPLDYSHVAIPTTLTEPELESELVDVQILFEDTPLFVPRWPALPATSLAAQAVDNA